MYSYVHIIARNFEILVPSKRTVLLYFIVITLILSSLRCNIKI